MRREEGALALFRGLGPRVGWMTLGGYIFFGAYEQCLRALTLMGRRDGSSREGPPPPPPLSAPPAASAVAEGASAAAAAAVDGGSDAAAAVVGGDARVSGDAADAADATAVTVEVALLAGAAAGISIDLVLFPLDTLKTRAIQGLELPGLHAFLSGSSGPLYQVSRSVSQPVTAKLPSATRARHTAPRG